MFSALISSGWLIFVGLTVADIHLPHGAQRWIPTALLLLVAWHYYLITRASREPILAAARARSAKTALVR